METETTGIPDREHLEADVVLRDGSTVRVRPVRADDEARLFEFLRGLSREALALRFFGALSEDALRSRARDLARDPGEGAFSLLATAGRDERVVGHAMYEASGDDRAEVAFLVADACQGQGLGSLLLGQLAQIASERGIPAFEAVFLPQNHRMLRVFRDSGFSARIHPQDGARSGRSSPPRSPRRRGSASRRRDWTAAVNAVRPSSTRARWR